MILALDANNYCFPKVYFFYSEFLAECASSHCRLALNNNVVCLPACGGNPGY